MTLLERISLDPAVAHGRPVIRGTRVRVADVLALLASGASNDEILEDYPYLQEEDLLASLQYAASQSDRAVLLVS